MFVEVVAPSLYNIDPPLVINCSVRKSFLFNFWTVLSFFRKFYFSPFTRFLFLLFVSPVSQFLLGRSLELPCCLLFPFIFSLMFLFIILVFSATEVGFFQRLPSFRSVFFCLDLEQAWCNWWA
ncbi:hypothetical protein N665_0191s0013 [Sinapis alba]|nr:hypothetical protein N665_0191s0013 [Sinapis alba]KAF8102863.1 hypothetical protein N665_0191s0013 [Sinapis alba]